MCARESGTRTETVAEEWRKRAEELAGTEDELLYSECVMKTRLYHSSLDLPQKKTHFPLLAERFRHYLQLLHAQGDALELVEAFEEAVEDWGHLCEADDDFIGWEEPLTKRAQRLEQTAHLAKTLFGELNPTLRAVLETETEKPAFQEFMCREFGNAEVLRCLEGRSEMESVRRAVEEEERLNSLAAELTAVLKETLRRPALEVSLGGTLSELLESARNSQNLSAVFAYLEGLGLEGVEPPAQQDLAAWKESLRAATKSSPEAAQLLQALSEAKVPSPPSP